MAEELWMEKPNCSVRKIIQVPEHLFITCLAAKVVWKAVAKFNYQPESAHIRGPKQLTQDLLQLRIEAQSYSGSESAGRWRPCSLTRASPILLETHIVYPRKVCFHVSHRFLWLGLHRRAKTGFF